MGHHLKKLENRMHHACFPADDELFKPAEQASGAMHSLAIHVHYQACDEDVRSRSDVNPNQASDAVGRIGWRTQDAAVLTFF